jgi:hypothetical protein
MRCQGDLKADDSLHLAPKRRLPAFHFELLGVELYCRQRRVGANLLVCGSIIRPQLEPALPSLRCVRETIDRQAEVRQDLVIDDIVKKNGIRVEGFLREDDAVFEWPVLADGGVPENAEISL